MGLDSPRGPRYPPPLGRGRAKRETSGAQKESPEAGVQRNSRPGPYPPSPFFTSFTPRPDGRLLKVDWAVVGSSCTWYTARPTRAKYLRSCSPKALYSVMPP